MNELKHAKVKTTTTQPDGSKQIETQSFYEELNSVKQEIQQSIRTSKETFVADLLHCTAVIADGLTREVTIHIEADHNHNPIRIVKTWTIKKVHYGR